MDIYYKEFVLSLREKIINDYVKKDIFDVTKISRQIAITELMTNMYVYCKYLVY